MSYTPKYITYDRAREIVLNIPKVKEYSSDFIDSLIETFMMEFDLGYAEECSITDAQQIKHIRDNEAIDDLSKHNIE